MQAAYLENTVSRSYLDERVFTFVVVANISAALYDAQAEAKKLSLTAKNARVLAIRAGELASGFKVITNFIDEFAHKTIDFAEDVHTVSLKISQIARHTSNIRDLLTRTQWSLSRLEQPEARANLERMRQQQMDELKVLDIQFRKACGQLESLLLEITDQMRAATFIASTSKVEAVQAGSYRDNLNSVALGISHASETINRAAKHCLDCLHAF